MPKYDYRCEECGYVTEVKHRMSETAEDLSLECGGCGSSKLEKMISTPIILLPGKDAGCTTCTTCSAASCPATKY